MSKEWYEHWFNTDFYHILYENRNDEEAGFFIEHLMSFLNIQKGSSIIDIGCGRGRHAHYLSEHGYEVTGIDIAQRNIDYAKKYEGQHLHFRCHDKRNVFKSAQFDLALNLFTSFGFIQNSDELTSTLGKMALNLKTGGLLVMDYLNEGKIRNSPMGKETQVHQSIEFNIDKHIADDCIVKEIEVFDGHEKQRFIEKVRLISLQEFEAMFESASLKILHTFGDYDLKSYNEMESDRLILIAEKY